MRKVIKGVELHGRKGGDGHGYAHILENIVPGLKQAGLSDDQLNMIFARNPKRFLSWQQIK